MRSASQPNRLLRENLEDFKKPLESGRDGISVEKRNLIHLSPVGAASVESYDQKLTENSLN
ncbi:MAG: hypothetical protein OXU51_18175 [Candidatus Poribacteria bacterium]|nr:hypothetical protein [Candidatus Poribacteria bacterium]